MIRVAAGLIVLGGFLSAALFFFPWLELRVTPIEPAAGGSEMGEDAVLTVSPADRAMGFRGFDLEELEVKLEERGTIDASRSISPAPMYWMFFAVPLVLLLTGLTGFYGAYRDWFHLSVLAWLVGLIGAALTIQRGMRDRLELWIRSDLGLETVSGYEVLSGAWLALAGYLIAMIGASWLAYMKRGMAAERTEKPSQS